MGKHTPSIVYYEDRCALHNCKNRCQGELQKHHIFGAANRKLADRDGLVVFLCRHHHTDSPTGVHHNRVLDLELKVLGQKAYMEAHNATEDDFRRRYGKSWLED